MTIKQLSIEEWLQTTIRREATATPHEVPAGATAAIRYRDGKAEPLTAEELRAWVERKGGTLH